MVTLQLSSGFSWSSGEQSASWKDRQIGGRL
jgi:hypothetical protein